MNKLTDDEVDKRAYDTIDLVNNPVFVEAIDTMKAKCIQDLIREPVGSLTASHAHASLQLLEGIAAQLQSFINDSIVRAKHRRSR